MAVAHIFKKVNPVIQGLQGMMTLLGQQESSLWFLVLHICNFSDMEGPLSNIMIVQMLESKEYVSKSDLQCLEKIPKTFYVISDLLPLISSLLLMKKRRMSW
jgi:hypothetical protein